MTLADDAINIYEKYKASNEPATRDILSKYPHWNDIFQKITEVWQNKYESHLQIINDQLAVKSLITKFRSEVTKIFSKKPDYPNLKKYYTHLIDYQVEYINDQVVQMILPSERQENKENTGTLTRRKSLRTADIEKKELRINLVDFDAKKNNNATDLVKELEKLSTGVCQPTVAHMMRCHSKQNDPNDSTSEVSDAVFELAGLRTSLDVPQTYTNMFASCGQNIINFIDAPSGKILKRFNDEHCYRNAKEVYTKLAWTILNGKSVLAAGGKHGQIKVIMPHKKVCISRFDAHSSQINYLLFHYYHSDILLSAADDCINIWRITIKDSEETIECECSYELIKKIEYKASKKSEKVLSMCFIPDDFLLITTELGNYHIKLTDNVMFNSSDATQMDVDEQDMETYLTTNPQREKKSQLTALKISIYAYSEGSDTPYEDEIVVNSLYYSNKTLMAALVNSKIIYKLEILDDITNEGGIYLKVISYIKMKKHSEYKNEMTTNLIFHASKDNLSLLQPAAQGSFYCIDFDEHLTKWNQIYHVAMPTGYTIKMKKDNVNIPVDDYNLCDKPIVLKCVCNEEMIVSVTNQNMILIWKK